MEPDMELLREQRLHHSLHVPARGRLRR
jgi:hypothetical protein